MQLKLLGLQKMFKGLGGDPGRMNKVALQCALIKLLRGIDEEMAKEKNDKELAKEKRTAAAAQKKTMAEAAKLICAFKKGATDYASAGVAGVAGVAGGAGVLSTVVNQPLYYYPIGVCS